MSSPTLLHKLGNKASEYGKAVGSLAPGDSELEGLKATQHNVDEAAQPSAPTAPATQEKQVPMLLHPLAKYGDKAGEQRIDTTDMLKPLPSYDLGGDVPEDQIAKVHEGEKVLSPEDAEQYRAEHPEKEEGAPVGFPGMVLPNPDHVEPVLDTDIEKKRDVDTDHLAGEAKPNIDNAPLKTPEGDIKNTPGVNLREGGEGKEISTLDLKPYGQVMEDKANAKAKDIASTQTEGGETGAQPEAKVEEKPKLTYGHLLAEQWMKSNGMGSLVPPKEFNQGSEQGGTMEQGATQPKALQADTGVQASKPGLKPIVSEPAAPAAAPQGKEAYKAKIAEYDKQYQALMDKAAQTNDPSDKEQAARVQEAKLAYEKQHPWGSAESAHPGLLGKLGHVGEMIASRAPGLAPIVATLPGSEGNRASEAVSARAQVKEANELGAADTKAAAKDATKIPGYKQVTGGAVDPKHPDLGPQVAFVNEKNPNDIVYRGPVTAKPSAGADKEAFKATLKKIGTAEVADPAQQKQALETAHRSNVITDDEYKDAMSYLGSTSNAPATQSTAAGEKRTAGKTMYFNMPDGKRKALTALEAKAEGLDPDAGVVENEGQVAKDREKNSTYRVIQSALGKYQDHINASSLTPDDVTVMTTLTEDAEKPDYVSKLIAGAFDDILGHPVTGYSEKLMKGTLTKNQYQDMSPAGRQLVADYYTTMMAHFANMKASQGTIPRNPYIIQTEMHTIPKPYLNSEEAKPAFQNYQDQVAMRNSDNVDFGGAGKKTEPVNPETITMPDGSHPADVAKGPNGDTIVWSGKQGDPWIDLATGKPVK